MKIPISKIYFDEEDFSLINQPLKNGWVVQGPFVEEFEKKFSEFNNTKFTTAVSSCTTALHLALLAVGIKKDDEVIVPAFTWISTANAVEYCGAKPVFCDINLDTFNIDVTKIEKLITPQTKAIVPVHLFGLSVQMDEILKIAKTYNLKIIEDAACGFGTKYKNIPVGNIGDIGCFSFHPRKAITTGEGGMITTNNIEFFQKINTLRNHGGSIADFEKSKNKYDFLLSEYNILGYNYRMTDLQGALGVSQISKSDLILSKRKEKAEYYFKNLKDLEWLKLPELHSYSNHSFQSFVCLFEFNRLNLDNIEEIHEKRNTFMFNLQQKGVSTRQGTHCVTLQNYYKIKYNFDKLKYPMSYIADKISIALPIYPTMTIEEQDFVINLILNTYK